MKCVHGWVSGRVQGVSYRYFAKHKAETLELKGWIKNLEDGRVEFLAQGKKNKINSFLEYCKKGPWFAKVTELKVKEEKAKKLESFEIKC